MILRRLIILRRRSAALCGALAMLAPGPAFGQEAPTPAAPAANPNPLAAIDASSLGGFRGRPLFTPSRRAPEPPPEPDATPEPTVEAAAPPPPAPQPDLKLTGVIESPEESVAVVRNGAATERLRLGDSVGGWLVTAIDPSAIRLTLGEREEEYRLFDLSKRPPALGAGSDPELDPTVPE